MVHLKLHTLCQKIMLMQMDFISKKYQPRQRQLLQTCNS